MDTPEAKILLSSLKLGVAVAVIAALADTRLAPVATAIVVTALIFVLFERGGTQAINTVVSFMRS